MALRIYSFWIFDRHCDAIYHQDWSHDDHSGPSASFASSLGATFQRVGSQTESSKSEINAGLPLRPAGDTLPNVSRHVTHNVRESNTSKTSADSSERSSLLPFDEEAKLVYGLVFSLRNLVRKIGGKQEQFYNFSTSTYTLSHLQTPSMYTFVMITDPPPNKNARGPLANFASASAIPGSAGMTLRGVLYEIWRGPWIQYAVHHPTVNCTEREHHTPSLPEARANASTDPSSDTNAPIAPSSKNQLQDRLKRTQGIDNDALREAIEKCK
ncbi:Trafficking protein particle complex subunit BET5 [Malassezia psittaci]|uniref:Trafficking protein particle complex subunit n=1 Tax=Malassezia psittaci TaxID=1821823 RepID=A0AAF0JFX8_9BASI|nr:Trafficking protein particle complex subunit BET5 [Malassezia psittaci]